MPKNEDFDVIDYKTERTKSILFKVLPYVFSVIFIALGLYLGIARAAVPAAHFASFVDVTATVDEVLEYKQPDNKPSKFRIKVSYTYNEQPYPGKNGKVYYNSSNCPVEGSQIIIKVNPKDPNELVERVSINYAEFIIGFGLAAVGGIIITIQTVKIARSRKNVKPKEEK